MNKIVLTVGSIGTTLIIVLASLTNVVSVQTVESDSGMISPLFNIRVKQALKEEQNALNRRYFGENDRSLQHLFPKDKQLKLYQKIYQIVCQMDEESRIKLKDLIMKIPNQNPLNGPLIEKLNPKAPKTLPLSYAYTACDCPPTIYPITGGLECLISYLIWILIWLVSIPINICVQIIQILIWLPYYIFIAIIRLIENIISS